jgi:hypothetical protein
MDANRFTPTRPTKPPLMIEPWLTVGEVGRRTRTLKRVAEGRKAKGRFRAEARLKTTFFDKLARGLLFKLPPLAFVEYEFPSTAEIQPALKEQYL